MMVVPVRVGTSNVRIVSATADYAFGESGNLILCVWRGSATAKGLADQDRCVRAHAASQSGATGIVVLIEAKSPVPTPEVRKQMSVSLGALEKKVRCVTILFEGDSMRSMVVRSTMAAVAVFKSQHSDMGYFGEPLAAQKWLASRLSLPQGFSLHGQIEAVRKAIKALPTA